MDTVCDPAFPPVPISRGIKNSEVAKMKMRIAHLGRKLSEEHKRKISEALKGRTKTDEHIRNNMLAFCISPNKCEQKLQNILNLLFPSEYRFVGDGQVIIAGRNPDFINVNGKKKIIELFGDYWHRGQNPRTRIDTFKPFGFETLVIWESELKNLENLKLRLRSFHTATLEESQ